MAPTKFDPATDAERWKTLPVIDFSAWREGTEADKASMVQALYGAATSSGFLYVKGHGVDERIIQNAYRASREFHNQPALYKANYHICKSKVHRGWVPVDQTSGFEQDGMVINNYYEAFDLSFEVPESHPRASQGYGLVGPNQWPDLPEFRERVSVYYDAVYQFGRELMSAFEQALELEPGTLLRNVTLPTSQLRLLKYYENDEPSDASNVGISAHSDYECFTVLHTSGPGLQLLSYDGHWVEAPPIPGAFVVNIGDCLEALTGGLFKATQHRVINLGAERYSLPFFFAVDYETEIKPLEKFRDEQSAAKYPSFSAGEHLWARTIQTFPYLKKRYQQGELPVAFEVAEENPFRRLSVEEMAEKSEQPI